MSSALASAGGRRRNGVGARKPNSHVVLPKANQTPGCDDDEGDQEETDDQQVDGGRYRHGRDLLDDAKQQRTDQRETQLVVPPIIGMAIELTA